MATKEELQKEALNELVEYSEKIIKGTEIVIKELRGTRKNDTDELFNLVIKGINWEIEVFNNCEPLINKDVQKIGNYQLKIPVYLDENENLCEEINDDCVYVLRKSNMTETFEYIRTKLDENNFIKDSTTYYDIYYKNAN